MKPKTGKTIYWIITALFGVLMFADGSAGLLRVAGAVAALANLGYPEYLSTIIGAAKILGVIAILQNVFPTLKEWAYAGFVFIFTGAFFSHYFSGSGGFFLILPVIMLAILCLAYFLRRNFETENL
jgi:hypothetical protein